MRTFSQMSLLVMCWLLGGCERTEAPPVTSQITQSPEKNLVALDIGRGQRPDGRALLTLGVLRAEDLPVPGLSTLTSPMQAEAMAVFNSTTAPCSPCMEDGVSVSDCLIRTETSCRNLQTLAQRIVGAARVGKSRHEIQPLVTYADPWKPSIAGNKLRGTEGAWTSLLGGPTWGEGSAPISVVLVVDYSDPFSRQMEEVWSTLLADKPVAVYLLHLPHARHSEAEGLARAVVAAGGTAGELHGALLKKEVATLETLGSQLGLDEAGWAARRDAVETTSVLEGHAQLAVELGIEATPATLINGYPVVGVRSLEFLQTILNNEIGDLEP
ncbi:MAG: hypothetical protein VX519_11985 [Myxococcota bacterium]|nr:hypothetical protein [Myxococcota bacterium]